MSVQVVGPPYGIRQFSARSSNLKHKI